MIGLIDKLKRNKQYTSKVEANITQLESELHLLTIWQELQRAKSLLLEYKEEAQEIDTQLRKKAIEEYQATGNKKPINGVSVIITKSLIYHPERAIRWAAANDAMSMLKLNTRDFEKHARAVADTIPLKFVSIEEVPQVRIAKEL